MTLYKVLGENGEPVNGGNGTWHLPKGKKPGKWMPPIEGDLVPCQNGYHLCREQDLIHWLGPTIWRSEYKGEMVENDNKIVVRQARIISQTAWNERIARLFAADCAEHTLPIFEKKYPNDDRPRNAIKIVRAFANGNATKEELNTAWDAGWAAAGDAARAAAWGAAGDAARATARAAAWATAGDAARAAAWDAARAAAGDAAWATARAAAGDAARDAARAAAWDAGWAAAGDAAWDAARAAAWDAGWAAEREWQTKRLMEYLNGEQS